MTPRFPIPPIEDDFSAHRWEGITRPYSAETVKKLRGSIRIEYTLAQMGARKLWRLLQNEEPTRALAPSVGGQAVQMGKAGLKAIYCSGWRWRRMPTCRVKPTRTRALYLPILSPPGEAPERRPPEADQIEHGEGGVSRTGSCHRGGCRGPASADP